MMTQPLSWVYAVVGGLTLIWFVFLAPDSGFMTSNRAWETAHRPRPSYSGSRYRSGGSRYRSGGFRWGK